jgi:hypothetical protein
MTAMKTIKLLIALLLLGAGNAWADRGGHVHFGVAIGPYWGPWYYPPSAYYYPPYQYQPYYSPVLVEPPPPQVYIEQQPVPGAAPVAPVTPVAAAPVSHWYYCAKAKGYYPYVKKCPGGWQKVSPQPPDQP